MRKLEAWWWICVPYSLLFPFLILVTHSKEAAGEALGLFVLIGILTAGLSFVWMIVVVYKVFFVQNAALNFRTASELSAVLLGLLLWALLLK